MKQIIHNIKKCGGIYNVLHTEENIPYLECDTCQHTIRDWVKWENEYSLLYKDDKKWTEKRHNLMCILGYFTFKFKEHYQFDYALSLNEKGLFRGPEVNILRRVLTSLGNNSIAVKEYIDWYFEVKIRRRRKKITNLSFLAVPTHLNEYKGVRLKAKTIFRDKKLSRGMVKWVKDFTPCILEEVTLEDYGDLYTLLQYIKAGSVEVTPELTKFTNELIRQRVIDFDFRIINWREDD